MLWRAISSDSSLCSFELSTETGILDHSQASWSSISPSSNLASSSLTTCRSISSSVISPALTASGSFSYAYPNPHSTSVPAVTPLAAACLCVDDVLWLVQKSAIAPQSLTTRYLNPHSSRSIRCSSLVLPQHGSSSHLWYAHMTSLTFAFSTRSLKAGR